MLCQDGWITSCDLITPGGWITFSDQVTISLASVGSVKDSHYVVKHVTIRRVTV